MVQGLLLDNPVISQNNGCLLCCRMPIISKLVDKSDMRVQGKANVNRVLQEMGFDLEDLVGKAFMRMT